MNNLKFYKLDLHGTFHSQVKDKVDKFISNCILDKAIEVEIITGNSDKMKALVVDVLKDYNLKSYSPVFNSGTLIIDMLMKL
jgi:dsDNA-specific endonuclease/ATPase MutS2